MFYGFTALNHSVYFVHEKHSLSFGKIWALFDAVCWFSIRPKCRNAFWCLHQISTSILWQLFTCGVVVYLGACIVSSVSKKINYNTVIKNKKNTKRSKMSGYFYETVYLLSVVWITFLIKSLFLQLSGYIRLAGRMAEPWLITFCIYVHFSQRSLCRLGLRSVTFVVPRRGDGCWWIPMNINQLSTAKPSLNTKSTGDKTFSCASYVLDLII